MIAIYKHELRSYFHSLTTYVAGAFLLAVIGIGAMLYNIQSAVSNFEFVLGFSSIVFAIIVPLLTMRVLAEERKQKTDQLLFSLPITTVQVILGKYLALLTIFALPVCIIALYPLIFAQFGNVYLPASYGSIFAFFLVGAALMALGLFISSLTDNQGLAAGIGVAVILFNYFSIDLAEYVSATPLGALVTIAIIILALGFLVEHLTKNVRFSNIITLVLLALALIAYLTVPEVFDGLLPQIMTKLSLFDQLDVFVNGVFDLTSVVYFLSVTAFFLFLSVQSLEKRRYN